MQSGTTQVCDFQVPYSDFSVSYDCYQTNNDFINTQQPWETTAIPSSGVPLTISPDFYRALHTDCNGQHHNGLVAAFNETNHDVEPIPALGGLSFDDTTTTTVQTSPVRAMRRSSNSKRVVNLESPESSSQSSSLSYSPSQQQSASRKRKHPDDDDYENGEDDTPTTPSTYKVPCSRNADVHHGKKPSRKYARFYNNDGGAEHRRWTCCGTYPHGRHFCKEELYTMTFHVSNVWIPEKEGARAIECSYCHHMVCASCHYQRRDLDFVFGDSTCSSLVTGINSHPFACNWCHSLKGGNRDGHEVLPGEEFTVDNPWDPKNVGMRAMMKNAGKTPTCDMPPEQLREHRKITKKAKTQRVK